MSSEQHPADLQRHQEHLEEANEIIVEKLDRIIVLLEKIDHRERLRKQEENSQKPPS